MACLPNEAKVPNKANAQGARETISVQSVRRTKDPRSSRASLFTK